MPSAECQKAVVSAGVPIFYGKGAALPVRAHHRCDRGAA